MDVVTQANVESYARMWEKLARVRALCEEQMIEDADGKLTDADTIWPSEVLAILDAPTPD